MRKSLYHSEVFILYEALFVLDFVGKVSSILLSEWNGSPGHTQSAHLVHTTPHILGVNLRRCLISGVNLYITENIL